MCYAHHLFIFTRNTIYNMHHYQQQINDTALWLQQNGIASPTVGIVLGTGLGELVNLIRVEKSIPYHQIPNFPTATVEVHKGNLVYGTIGHTQVLAMQGRFHYYEGYNMQQVTFPIRVMKALGVQHLLLSNAAGGINLHFKKGDLVLIDDHINLLPESPLRGLNDASFGDRFPDMSKPYDAFLSSLLTKHAEAAGKPLKTGVYAAVMGPNLETRAEYRYLKVIGADIVGMSTVPEVIVANQCGIPCAAISVITDECDPENLKPVSLAEIVAVAAKADVALSSLFAQVIEELG